MADIPKCGIMIDFGRDEAPAPTQYPIPKVITRIFFFFLNDVFHQQHSEFEAALGAMLCSTATAPAPGS